RGAAGHPRALSVGLCRRCAPPPRRDRAAHLAPSETLRHGRPARQDPGSARHVVGCPLTRGQSARSMTNGPLVVTARTVGPPDPRSVSRWRRICPCTVIGIPIDIGPFDVPVSRCAEYASGMLMVAGPLVVSASSPRPTHVLPVRRTESGPFVVRPCTSPPASSMSNGPFTALSSILPCTDWIATGPLVAVRERSEA